MIKSDNIFWGIEVAPYLPRGYVQEYMTLLGEYAKCRVTSAKPSRLDQTWYFPFMEIDESFNCGEFEDWAEMVERDMMERYSLTEHHFSTFLLEKLNI